MYRYQILIEYDGSRFFGWQIQKKGKTIQGIIQKKISKLLKEKIIISAAGRTDAGVHALGQVAHFDLDDNKIPEDKIFKALNSNLRKRGNKITILKSTSVSSNFHARFSAKKKTYLYQILNRQSISYLQNESSWFFPKPLNIEKMSYAAKYLLGSHDFNAFRSIHCQSKNSVRSIDSISIKKKQQLISIRIKGKSFLHNQIRIIVGSIVMVGEGKWNINYIKSVLESKDRKIAGPTAPAHGLYLEKIIY